MRQLVYRSFAAVPYDRERLTNLLARARAFNATRGVTGVLLYHQGMFAQCLEGPHENVDAVWQRIARDTTHSDLILLENIRIQRRSFESWSMACTEISAADWQRFEDGGWGSDSGTVSTPGLMIMQSLWDAYREAAI